MANGTADLNSKVEREIGKGWIPHGGVAVGYSKLYQAMIKATARKVNWIECKEAMEIAQ